VIDMMDYVEGMRSAHEAKKGIRKITEDGETMREMLEVGHIPSANLRPQT
jgi:hypothetical protein